MSSDLLVARDSTVGYGQLEKLDAPPIVEVVCGIGFEAIMHLDPVVTGSYWRTRRSEYPHHQLLPAILDPDSLSVGPLPPLRTWLVSADDSAVLQIQTDRFYVNWRLRGESYPRFSDHDGKTGLLTKTLEEFEAFSAFCHAEIDVLPKPASVDLMKVDHLVEGRHWSDFQDLARCIPWLGRLAQFSTSQGPNLALQFSEPRQGGKLVVVVRTQAVVEDQRVVNVLSIEARLTKGIHGGVHETFVAANDELNRVFMSMIPVEERRRRFAGRED